jgi:DNA-binding MarR family transcriptional regulator
MNLVNGEIDQVKQQGVPNSERQKLVELIVALESVLAQFQNKLAAAAKGQASEREILLVSACRTLGQPNQRQLAAHIGISPAQTSDLVEKLRRRAWIDKVADPADRRRQCWRVTESGDQFLAQIDEQLGSQTEESERPTTKQAFELHRQLANLQAKLELRLKSVSLQQSAA